MPEYPEQAVHEVIVNALIHRDYMEIGSEIHIDIFLTTAWKYILPAECLTAPLCRILIRTMWPLSDAIPSLPIFFSRMHFMERRGSGFKKSRQTITVP